MEDTSLAPGRHRGDYALPDPLALTADQLQRLSQLMDAHTEGTLTACELQELVSLVELADDLDFANLQRMVELRVGNK